jgi:hypothetical protein
MSVRPKHGSPGTKLGLWQKPTFALFWRPDLLALKVSAADPDLLSVLADGSIDVEPPPRGQAGLVYLRLLASHRPLYVAVCRHWLKLQRRVPPGSADSSRLHLHAAVRLLGGDQLGLVFGSAARSNDPVLAALLPTESTIQKARDLLAAHRAAKAQVKLKRLMAKADSKALADKLPPEARKRIEGILEARDALAELSEPPLPPLAPLLTELSWAVAFGVRSSDLEVVCRAAEREVRKRLDEHHPPPADGTFAVTVVGQPGRAATAFTTWNPHSGLPPYAEVRAAVERTVPSAFARPRRVGAHPPPYFEQTAGPEADLAVTAASFDFPDPWRLDVRSRMIIC